MTPAEALALIRDLAPHTPYAEIARQLNDAGWHTAFGRPFTSLHVGYGAVATAGNAALATPGTTPGRRLLRYLHHVAPIAPWLHRSDQLARLGQPSASQPALLVAALR